jgi:hypothetical protein
MNLMQRGDPKVKERSVTGVAWRVTTLRSRAVLFSCRGLPGFRRLARDRHCLTDFAESGICKATKTGFVQTIT